MKTTHQYKIYPDTNQKLELNEWLRICRYWYNRQLGDRFDWWENNRHAVNSCPIFVTRLPELLDRPNYYIQKLQLPAIKKDLSLVQWSGELLDFKSVDSTDIELRELVEAYPDATLVELCELFADKTGNWVGRSAMCRALQKLGLNRKKKQSGVPKQERRES